MDKHRIEINKWSEKVEKIERREERETKKENSIKNHLTPKNHNKVEFSLNFPSGIIKNEKKNEKKSLII